MKLPKVGDLVKVNFHDGRYGVIVKIEYGTEETLYYSHWSDSERKALKRVEGISLPVSNTVPYGYFELNSLHSYGFKIIRDIVEDWKRRLHR